MLYLLGVLPKAFYTVFQGSFLIALICLNWDFLTAESDGIVIFIIIILLALGTHIFYFLTGSLNPGFVLNQIFENQIETVELVEEEDLPRSQNNR